MRSRLTEEQIREIVASNDLHSVLARRYGVCRPHVSQIKSGRCCSKITGIDRKPSRPPKTTAEDAAAIVRSPEPDSVIAARYGITQKTVWRIRHGGRWQSVTAGIEQPGRPGREKLTAADVEEIYFSHESDQALAERYGVNWKQIWRIRKGKRWRKLTAELSKRRRFKFESLSDLIVSRRGRAQHGRRLHPSYVVEIFISSEPTTTLARRYRVSPEYVQAIRGGSVMREITSRIVPNLGRRRVWDRTHRIRELAA